MSVGKIPRKFTDGNIPSVFPFVFIGFLVVSDEIFNESAFVSVESSFQKFWIITYDKCLI
jgi:hypothetical protein